MNSPAPRGKGPLVWLDLDQQALDDAYDQSVYAPNHLLITGRRAPASERARARIGQPERRAYGPAEIEQLDIYRAKQSNAPVNIYIHGGAWRSGKASDFGYQAEMFISAGAHHVVPDFNNADETGGDLLAMAEQVQRAVGWVYKNAASFGGDPNRLYLTGHSSGAHLSGCIVTHDWVLHGFPADILKGAMLISGMYDLKAVRLSKRSLYVNFTDAMEQALSAQRHLDKLHTPLILAYGTCETPEFIRQTRDFHAAVTAAGKPARLVVAEAYNHFEILETLANPYGLLGRMALEQMGLVAA